MCIDVMIHTQREHSSLTSIHVEQGYNVKVLLHMGESIMAMVGPTTEWHVLYDTGKVLISDNNAITH